MDTSEGEHKIRDFRHRYGGRDYEVKFYFVSPKKAEQSDSDSHGWSHPHYRLDVTPTEGSKTSYIRFSKPPQKLTWMMYYLRETLAVYLKPDKQTIDYPALLHPVGGEEGFRDRMTALEHEYQVNMRGVAPFTGDVGSERKPIAK